MEQSTRAYISNRKLFSELGLMHKESRKGLLGFVVSRSNKTSYDKTIRQNVGAVCEHSGMQDPLSSVYSKDMSESQKTLNNKNCEAMEIKFLDSMTKTPSLSSGSCETCKLVHLKLKDQREQPFSTSNFINIDHELSLHKQSSMINQSPLHRKSEPRIGQFLITWIGAWFWLATINSSLGVSGLRTGEYPPYDSLCVTSGRLIPVMWDCTGYVQCMPLGDGSYRAVWTQCSGGRYFDPSRLACVLNYDKCSNPLDAAVNLCPSMPHLRFPHPSSCALYYDCSQPLPRPGLSAWENECPEPELFDHETYTCIRRQAIGPDICNGRPEPSWKCDYRLGCSDQNCTGLVDGPHYDPSAPFSETFYICYNGSIVRKTQCEEDGHIFDPQIRECTDALHRESIESFCTEHPTKMFADPTRCSLFFDCSRPSWHPSLGPYQTECAYPRLFDPSIASCASYNDVNCGKRPVTIQPCDYLVGHCIDAGCIPCVASCLGLPDGLNAYPGRVLTAFYLVCDRERTIDIRTCAEGSIFDPQLRTCSREISSQTLDVYCADNPDGRIVHPSECSVFYSCSQHNDTLSNPNLPPRAMECKYPYLVHAGTVTCKPHTVVKCGSRREPFSPCDYVSNRCTSVACTKCELVLPSCYGKADNYYPAINQEMTANYIVCRDQRVMGSGVCPNGTIFDIRTLTCTDTVYALSLLEFCTNYQTGRVQNPSNCAQYYDCAMSLTEVMECTYPDLYDVTSHLCLPFDQVDCRGKPVFLNPCDSFTFCPVQPCPYCDTAYPSCVGREGESGWFRFEPSMFYRCHKDRLMLGYCQTTFNKTLGTCNEIISPVPQISQVATTNAVSVVTTVPTPLTTNLAQLLQDDLPGTCTAMPTLILYKNDNCAQYFNCSHPDSPLGPFVGECAIGSLFNTTTNQCQPFNEVDCNGRYEPKQACQYQTLCPNSSSTACTDCHKRYPSCQNVTSGPAPSSFDFDHSLVVCQDGRVRQVTSCPIGQVYSHENKTCMDTLTADTALSGCQRHPGKIIAHPLHCAKYIRCGQAIDQGTPTGQRAVQNFTVGECPYPLLFSNGLCRGFRSVDCGRRKEAIAPCDYSKLSECQVDKTTKCHVQDAVTCPEKEKHSCTPCEERYPSCIGLPDGFLPYPSRLFTPDFIKCEHGRTMAIIKCVNSIFDPDLKKCGLSLSAVQSRAVHDPITFCTNHPTSLLPDPRHCARFFNCSMTVTHSLSTEAQPHLDECPYPQLFDPTQLKCDNFIEVLNTDGCGKRFQPKHYCDYMTVCPSPRFSTCDECRRVLPSCEKQSNGIHGNPPGREITRSFVYCVEGRVLATSPCPPGTMFHESSKSCQPKQAKLG